MNKEILVHYKFGGIGLFGDAKMKMAVCEAISRFPDEVIEFATEKCWFVSNTSEYWAFSISGKHLSNKYLIFLTPALFEKLHEFVLETIAHEIAHAYLKHKSPVLDDLTDIEAIDQEADAAKFLAKKWKKEKAID